MLRVFFHTGGETWPGELLLRLFPGITRQIAHCFDRTIYVVGTNGKTSTSKLVREMLKHEEYALITNPSGANLLNGLVTNFFLQKKIFKNNT